MEAMDKEFMWKSANEISNYIKLRCEETLNSDPFKPCIAIICGSGLADVSDILDGDDEKMSYKRLSVPYSEIPHMPISQVDGHLNKLVFGTINNQYQVLCFQGRSHFYEGIPYWKLILPLRALKIMGIKIVFLTNVASCLSDEFKTGDIMLIKSHIDLPSLIGLNPLLGPNDDRFGIRFPDCSQIYSKKLIEKAQEAVKELNLGAFCRAGVYIRCSGPNYSTLAETQFLQNCLKGDAVGSSLSDEALVLYHSSLAVCGLSLIADDYICATDELSDMLEQEIPITYKHPEIMSMHDESTTITAIQQQEKRKSLREQEAVLALSVDDGSRRIGQIIKNVVLRLIKENALENYSE